MTRLDGKMCRIDELYKIVKNDSVERKGGRERKEERERGRREGGRERER